MAGLATPNPTGGTASGITTESAGVTYKAKSTLTAHMIAECEAVFAIAIKTLNDADPTSGQIASFWRGTFDRWNSSRLPTMPRYKQRQSADSSVEAGTFSCDLPLGKSEEVQEQPLAGCPAFVKVHVGGPAKALGWLWVDSANQTASTAYIDFYDDQPMHAYIQDAMIQYDKAELARLALWNCKLAIYMVRRRINHWTKNGCPSAVGGEDSLMAKMEQIVLCRELLPVYTALAQNILDTDDSGGIPAPAPTFPVSW